MENVSELSEKIAAGKPVEYPIPGKKPEIKPSVVPEHPPMPGEKPEVVPKEEPFESPPPEMPQPEQGQ